MLFFFSTFSRPNYCLSTLQIKVEPLSEICCDVLNRNLCCCKGNNDYFSTLELYAWWKKSWKNASDVICVFFPTLVCGRQYDRIRFHGAQCVEIISETKVLFLWTFSRDISYSFILTMNVWNVRNLRFGGIFENLFGSRVGGKNILKIDTNRYSER